MQTLKTWEIIYRCERGHRSNRDLANCSERIPAEKNGIEINVACMAPMSDVIIGVENFRKLQKEAGIVVEAELSRRKKGKLAGQKVTYVNTIPTTTTGISTTALTMDEAAQWAPATTPPPSAFTWTPTPGSSVLVKPNALTHAGNPHPHAGAVGVVQDVWVNTPENVNTMPHQVCLLQIGDEEFEIRVNQLMPI